MRNFSSLIITVAISVGVVNFAECAEKGVFVPYSHWGRSKIPGPNINRERLISMKEAAGAQQSSPQGERSVEWAEQEPVPEELRDRASLKKDVCAGITLCTLAAGIIYWFIKCGPW